MLEQTIISLAILKVNWEKGNDYIENFVPFVVDCLRSAPQPEVSLPQLQGKIFETFGLAIPQGALKTIVGRAVKRGYAKRVDGIYRRDNGATLDVDLGAIRTDALRQHEALVGKLAEFCEVRYQEHWSKSEVEAALLSYLKERSVPILAAAVEGDPIPAAEGAGRDAEYLVGAFVRHLCESDPEGFEYLYTVVKGSMLANVLYFPELGRVAERFDGVDVYFDSQVLLRALGLAGPTMQASIRELMELLYQLNARLRCFEHTVREIKGILDAASHVVGNPMAPSEPLGETFEYFVQSGYLSSDVELVIARLERSLASLRVTVKAKPPHTVPLGVDEQELQRILKEMVGYRNEEALRHDLESLTAIHRLRGGSVPSRLESCRALFVTANPRLTRASGAFFESEYGQVGVPTCILDHVMTTLAWLKGPLRAPDLPRKMIIADCYAAMNPPDDLWRRYLREANRLRESGDLTDEDYSVLRFSSEARVMLMDLTRGESDAFAEGTVPEVLQRARGAARAEVEAALKAETEKRMAAEERAAEIESRAAAERQAEQDRFRAIGAQVGSWTRRALLICTVPVVCLCVFLALARESQILPHGWPLWVTALVGIILGVGETVGLMWGTTVDGFAKGVEVRVARMVEGQLMGLVTPPGSAPAGTCPARGPVADSEAASGIESVEEP